VTLIQGTSRRRATALVLLAGAVGLLAAAASLWWAFILIAYGGLLIGGWATTLSLCELAGGVLGVWGAVRLLRRRGWRLLAAASLLGLYPSVIGTANALRFGWDGPDMYQVLAYLPPAALVLVLLPPVRRWVTRREADHPVAVTCSGA
jgi:hypothetical protein